MFRIFQWAADWLARRAAERAKRDEGAWCELERVRDDASARGMRLGEVIAVRQHAKTGTKAWMRWIGTDDRDAVWIWNHRLLRGQVVCVSGNHGHGPHHNEPVFYIERIGQFVPHRTYKGWLRHEARLTAS